MSERPDYVPPLRFGEGTHPRSPRAVLAELLAAPPSACGFGVFLFANGQIFAVVVTLMVLVIALVQAMVYVPRALAAARLESRQRSR